MTLDDDQSGYVFRALEFLDRFRDSFLIIGIADPRHIPAIGEETSRNIVAESEVRAAFDRHFVTVVNPA